MREHPGQQSHAEAFMEVGTWYSRRQEEGKQAAEVQSLILDMLSLRCLLEIRLLMLSRLLEAQKKKSSLEKEIWVSALYRSI